MKMLETMYKTMIARLKQFDASQEVIDDYTTHWNDAMKNPGKPIPCPDCFRKGNKDSRLEPLPRNGNTENVKCKSCKEYFSYEEPAI